MHLTRIWPAIPPKWNFTHFSRRAAAVEFYSSRPFLPSVNDILDIAANESKENAIFIAQTEID
jgi:hypothetical protein